MSQLFSPDPAMVPPLSADQQEPQTLNGAQAESEDVFVLPASFAQQRLWFLEQWEPGVYTISLAVTLVGDLDMDAMEKSYREIIRRHESLRTIFRIVNSQLQQVVVPHMPFSLSVVDLRMFADDVKLAKLRRLIYAEVQQPFDLNQGPLLRVTILRSTDQRNVMLLSMHHIISDGWSMEVVFNEFKTLYAAYVFNYPSPLPELPLQYADYAIWQRDWLEGEVLNEQIAYWHEQLADLPVLQLPFDHPRPAVQTFRGAVCTMIIPKELTAALHTLSRSAGVTLFMTLLSAFQTLLYRYSDQLSIPIGTPIAGRSDSKLESLIGCFINTLVIRTDFSNDPTFWEILKRVREVALEAYENQDVPFEKLVEILQPGRDLSHNPLTQVMFTLQNVPQHETKLPHLEIVQLDMVEHERQSNNHRQVHQHQAMVENKTAMFDLDMTLWERGDILFGEFKYNTDLFEPETIDRFHEHFLILLQHIVTNPTQRVSHFPLLPEKEYQLLNTEWNDTEDTSILAGSFIADFLRQVAKTPESIAVKDAQGQATYWELHLQALRLAIHLQMRKLQPEQVIGLYTRRDVFWAVAVLGIFYAGGVYLPLDPQYPVARLHSILEQSSCQLLLCHESQLSHLHTILSNTIIDILCGQELLNTPLPSNNWHVPHYHMHQLAYIIFTSGSTGQPKGVMVEHQGMYNHLYAKIMTLDMDERDIIAQTASQCFDISIWQLLSGWLVGAQVNIYLDQVVANPETILQYLQDDRVTILEGVPSWLRALLDVQSGGRISATLEGLRWVIPTGEALPVDLCRSWLQRYPHIPLLNAYGPTECSDDVTHQIIDNQEEIEVWGATAPIGRPVLNLRIYVLDRQHQIQPIGVWGEIYIGGIGVGRGYVGDAVRSAEVFVPDMFSNQPGARLYRTGDVGRYRADGCIEFLGRIDHQVKLRGYRIELGEIEQALRHQPHVRESVVVINTDHRGRERLIGYIVVQPGVSVSVDEMQLALREELPEYMVPAVIVTLDALPTSLSGKVDRQALPEPQEHKEEQRAGYVAPRTPLEEQLATLWSELLGIECVGIQDDFFTIGGHSLLTVRLMTCIEQQFGERLPLTAIFQGRTIEALAEILSRQAETSPWSAATEVEAHLPTVDLQAEATLDREACPEVWPEGLPPAPAKLLLTGATGFLGTFLLVELLQHTNAHIYCLVRAADAAEGAWKLQKELESAGAWQTAFGSRITPVIGDLTQSRLGLEEQTFDDLARQIDTIYHNGAFVNMFYPYEHLKAANVEGTREIIRLATRYRVKPLHYISTLSVLPYRGEGRTQYIREQDALDDYREYVRGGYAQSKWVAEKIVTIARSRGLPVVVYRPGRITGHSQSGIWQSDDVLCQMIKACIQVGKCPLLREDDMLELLPVDYVSRAIVALSLRKTSLGQVFHLCDPSGTKVNDLVEWVNDYGYGLERVEYQTWVTELAGNGDRQNSEEISPLISLFIRPTHKLSAAAQPPKVVYDNRHTVTALKRVGVSSPTSDVKLLHTYLDYLVQSGFLQPPLCP